MNIKTYISIMILILFGIIVSYNINNQHVNRTETNIKISYEKYRRDVCDLVWCYLQYDRRRIAPIETEYILRIFDFRPDSMCDYVTHSFITRDFNTYLSKNTKHPAISNYIERTRISWEQFETNVFIYNSDNKIQSKLTIPKETEQEKIIKQNLESVINSIFR